MVWKLRYIGGSGEVLHFPLLTNQCVIDSKVPVETPHIQDYRRLIGSGKYELIEAIDDSKPKKTFSKPVENPPQPAEATK